MLNYELVIKDDKGNSVAKFELDKGESKKGTYTTLSGKPANKVLPFGKLYVDEDKIANGKKAKATK